MFLTLSLVLGFDMCKYYFNQRDWHMNQYCNLGSELDMSAVMTGDTFADYTAKYIAKSAPVAVVTDFVEIREVYGTCQIYLFGINGGTLKNAIIYFNASVDVSTRECTRVEFSPIGMVVNNGQNEQAVNNLIISGVVNITVNQNQQKQLSTAFSYVLDQTKITGVKSNLKININNTEQTGVQGSFDNTVTVGAATEADLGQVQEFKTRDGPVVKIRTDTFGDDYDALDFVQLAYQGMGAFTKMFVKKAVDANVFAFSTEQIQEQPTGFDQELLVAVGNTETVAFTDAGFTICSPYDGQYDVTSKTCLQSTGTCSDKWSIEDRICLKTSQNCPSAYYKKDEGKKCYSSIDISQGQTSNQDNKIVTCQTNQKAFENNTCQATTACPSGFIPFGTQGCVLECPEGNEQENSQCKIPNNANECTGNAAKYIQARANRPAMCLSACPSEYYGDGNQCKLTCGDNQVYDPTAKTCGTSCTGGYMKQERYCVKQCSSKHIKKDEECVMIDTDTGQCPDGMFADVPMSMCVPCGVLTKAYWNRPGANYDKTKCVDTCNYYNFSQYKDSNKPAELLGKINMFFCEQIKTETCRVYETRVNDQKNVCKDTCYSLSKFLKNESDPQCIDECPNKRVEYKDLTATIKEYICNENCNYYKTETTVTLPNPKEIKNCSECTDANHYRHKNKDCDVNECSIGKDGDSMFILKQGSNNYFECIAYGSDETNCPFARLETDRKHVCTPHCLAYCDKDETFTNQVSYKQCVNTTNNLNINDCPQETPQYHFFSEQQNNRYKCEARCDSQMFLIDETQNKQKICTSTCKTYYPETIDTIEHKHCIDKTNVNVAECKKVIDTTTSTNYKYVDTDNALYKCVSTCGQKYVGIDEICVDTCTTGYYRAQNSENVCLEKCSQNNETIVSNTDTLKKCVAFTECTTNNKFLQLSDTGNQCVEKCGNDRFFYDEQTIGTESYFTCNQTCQTNKAKKEIKFGQENAYKCVTNCDKVYRRETSPELTLCLDKCDVTSEFLVTKQSKECVTECENGITYYYRDPDSQDNICLQSNECSVPPYMRKAAGIKQNYIECKVYCTNDQYFYKMNCQATEDQVDAQCCKQNCSEFTDATYYTNDKLCITKCTNQDGNQIYAYRYNSTNDKKGQCTDQCESHIYIVDQGSNDVQTQFCDNCEQGYHIKYTDAQTVECITKCPPETKYAYPHGNSDKQGLCVDRCEPAEFEEVLNENDSQKFFCTTCTGFYVMREDTQKQCYSQCPSTHKYHNQNQKQCLDSCAVGTYRREADKTCYTACPDGTFTNTKASTCDDNCAIYDITQKFCMDECNGEKLTFNSKVVCLLNKDGTQCTNNNIVLQIKETGDQVTNVIASCDESNSCGELQYDNICITSPKQLGCDKAEKLMTSMGQQKNLPYKNGQTCVASCSKLATGGKFIKDHQCVDCDQQQSAVQRVGEEYECKTDLNCDSNVLQGKKSIFSQDYTFCSECTDLCKDCADFNTRFSYTNGQQCVDSCGEKFTNETSQQCVDSCGEGKFYKEEDTKKICKDACDANQGNITDDQGRYKCIEFAECKKGNLFVKEMTSNSYECVEKCNTDQFFYKEIDQYLRCENICEKAKKEQPFTGKDLNSYKCVENCANVYREITGQLQYTLCLDTCDNNEFLHPGKKQCQKECQTGIKYYRQKDGNNVCQNSDGCTEKPYVKPVDSKIKEGYIECRPYCKTDGYLYNNNCNETEDDKIDENCCKSECSAFGDNYYKDGLLCVTKCPDAAKYAKSDTKECVVTCDDSSFEETGTADQKLFCTTCSDFYVIRDNNQKQCYQTCPNDYQYHNNDEKQCLAECNSDKYKYEAGKTCYTQCPEDKYTTETPKTCKDACDQYDLTQKFCMASCDGEKLVFGDKTICLRQKDGQECQNNKVALTITKQDESISNIVMKCMETETCTELDYSKLCVTEPVGLSCKDVDELMVQLNYKKGIPYSNNRVCVDSCSKQQQNRFVKDYTCVTCNKLTQAVQKFKEEYECKDSKACDSGVLYGEKNILGDTYTFCSTCTGLCKECSDFSDTLGYTDNKQCVNVCQGKFIDETSKSCLDNCGQDKFYREEGGKKTCKDACDPNQGSTDAKKCLTFQECKNTELFVKEKQDGSYECVQKCKDDQFFYKKIGETTQYLQCTETCDTQIAEEEKPFSDATMKSYKCVESCPNVYKKMTTPTPYTLCLDKCDKNSEFLQPGSKECKTTCQDTINYYYFDGNNNMCLETNACTKEPYMREDGGIAGFKECKTYCTNTQNFYKQDCTDQNVDQNCCNSKCSAFGNYYAQGKLCVTTCPDSAKYAYRNNASTNAGECTVKCSPAEYEEDVTGTQKLFCATCTAFYVPIDGSRRCYAACPTSHSVYVKGDGARECLVDCGDMFNNSGVCQADCQDGKYNDRKTKQCVDQCAFYDLSQRFCLDECQRFLEFKGKKICLEKTDQTACDKKVIVTLTIKNDAIENVVTQCKSDDTDCQNLDYDGMCLVYDGNGDETCQRTDAFMKQLKYNDSISLIYKEDKTCVASCADKTKFVSDGNCVESCNSDYVTKQGKEFQCDRACDGKLHGNIQVLGKTVNLCSSCTGACSQCDDFKNDLSYTLDGECVTGCNGRYIDPDKKCVSACNPAFVNEAKQCLQNCESTGDRYEEDENGMKRCTACEKYNENKKCITNCKDAGLYYNETQKACVVKCDQYANKADPENMCVEKCATGYADTDKLCVEACQTYFQEPDGTKTCRECTSDERRTTDSEGRTRCMKDCPENAPYFDNDDKTCKDVCPVFHEQNFCLQACMTKLYETRDSKLFCIETCPSPRFEAVSTSYKGHRECVDKCPTATPYYIAETFTCADDCTRSLPYYDWEKRACVASCDATLYYPDPNGANISCTDCSSGDIFDNDGMKQCLANCPAGYNAVNGVCEATASNKGAASWWVWAVIAAAVLLLIIIVVVTVIIIKKHKAAKMVSDNSGIAYYSRRLRVNAPADANNQPTRAQQRRPVDAPQNYRRFASAADAPRRGIVSGYRAGSGSGGRSGATDLSRSAQQSRSSVVDLEKSGSAGQRASYANIPGRAPQWSRGRMQ